LLGGRTRHAFSIEPKLDRSLGIVPAILLALLGLVCHAPFRVCAIQLSDRKAELAEAEESAST
jgi:hypothetical protein